MVFSIKFDFKMEKLRVESLIIQSSAIKQAMNNIVDRASELVMFRAQMYYFYEKRKQTKRIGDSPSNSFVFNSFRIRDERNIENSGFFNEKPLYKASRVIMAGGPNSKAYYAIYLDQGFTMRNGAQYPGYQFMEEGIKYIIPVLPLLVKEEFNKVGIVVV